MGATCHNFKIKGFFARHLFRKVATDREVGSAEFFWGGGYDCQRGTRFVNPYHIQAGHR